MIRAGCAFPTATRRAMTSVPAAPPVSPYTCSTTTGSTVCPLSARTTRTCLALRPGSGWGRARSAARERRTGRAVDTERASDADQGHAVQQEVLSVRRTIRLQRRWPWIFLKTPTMAPIASSGRASNSSSTRMSGFERRPRRNTASSSRGERIGGLSRPRTPAISAAIAPATTAASGSAPRCSTLVATTSNPSCAVSLRSRRTTCPTIHDLPLCRGAQTVT